MCKKAFVTVDEIIEHIEDDMGCANDCPMKDNGDYDIDFCICYKADVIDKVQTMAKELESKDGFNGGNKW